MPRMTLASKYVTDEDRTGWLRTCAFCANWWRRDLAKFGDDDEVGGRGGRGSDLLVCSSSTTFDLQRNPYYCKGLYCLSINQIGVVHGCWIALVSKIVCSCNTLPFPHIQDENPATVASLDKCSLHDIERLRFPLSFPSTESNVSRIYLLARRPVRLSNKFS